MHLQSYPRRCVLIIDDDPVFTLLASETLQQAGFDARIASNTRDALASVSYTHLDVYKRQAREHVRRCAGLVERKPCDAVHITVELPIGEGIHAAALM